MFTAPQTADSPTGTWSHAAVFLAPSADAPVNYLSTPSTPGAAPATVYLLPAADRDSIFIPFFTTKHGGTGIGLALSRQIMVRQGGNLELMDRPASGYTTTFRLTFA